MVKKTLLGCAILAVLLAVGLTLLAGLDWSAIGTAGDSGSRDEKLGLARELSREFGDQLTVEFVCRLPVVGEVPCLPGEGAGSREVTLTFTGYQLPAGVNPHEHARRIAGVAYAASTFLRGSDKTTVVFHEGDESASVRRSYSFAAHELAPDDGTADY